MHMLAMSGHQYLKLYGDIILAITNIILNVVLIPLWGPLGAAIATAASIAGINIVRVLQVKYVLHVYPYSFRYLKVLLCGVISALSGYFVQYLLKDNFYIISMLISTSIMIIVYFFDFLLFCDG
ncbi:polysaccharide biosynthesis C-terminal domain-containing protein [Acaryochloris sp. 'Moss Beach']|uniref:polysaccharide biosynthesis C-terminal domain-containing protein n=1 Tax=Acaryochloris sp. 'Moss Beach' TaxID=2740837 RepID=UPI001F39B7F1|nr:polysaccharide biosynthesis C-terminal domain-containing protein [Acaryochloris sp. 'Moss Beach']